MDGLRAACKQHVGTAWAIHGGRIRLKARRMWDRRGGRSECRESGKSRLDGLTGHRCLGGREPFRDPQKPASTQNAAMAPQMSLVGGGGGKFRGVSKKAEEGVRRKVA